MSVHTWFSERWRDPVAWTEAVQLVKTVVAAVAAWAIATYVFDLPQAFLAPWSALLVVHATVYRTFSEGAQQVGATVVGVLLAWAAGNLLGLDPVAMGVMLAVSLVLGKVTALRLDGTAVAATAVVVLTVGYSDEHQALLLRFLDTGIGIAVGLLVNLLVWPPLRDRSAARAVDAIDEQVGGLLMDIAGDHRRSYAFGTMSGGEKQRLFLVLALLNQPKLVILDELTQGLDPAARREVWSAVTQLRDAGTTVLLVTHELDEAEELCDRVVAMRAGQVLDAGTPAELVARHAAEATIRFGIPDRRTQDLPSLRELSGVRDVVRDGDQIAVVGNRSAIAHVGAWLVARGPIPGDLRVEAPDLEDALLTLLEAPTEKKEAA